jgi:hypothetical protein
VLFVPVIPHHAAPPSPRTRELADLLARAIEEYEKYHPNISGPEVRAALQLAAQSSRKAGPDPRLITVAATLGALLIGFVVMATRGGDLGGGATPVVAVVAVVLVIAFMALVLVRQERG